MVSDKGLRVEAVENYWLRVTHTRIIGVNRTVCVIKWLRSSRFIAFDFICVIGWGVKLEEKKNEIRRQTCNPLIPQCHGAVISWNLLREITKKTPKVDSRWNNISLSLISNVMLRHYCCFVCASLDSSQFERARYANTYSLCLVKILEILWNSIFALMMKLVGWLCKDLWIQINKPVIPLFSSSSGLHLSDISTLKNGAFELVNDKTPSKEVVVVKSSSNKRMKMNCFSNVPARLVLYFLSWSGFLVSFMMRNDINFAIVVMVRSNNPVESIANGNLSANVTESPIYVSFIYRIPTGILIWLSAFLILILDDDSTSGRWTGGVWLGLADLKHGAQQLLLDVRRQSSCRWCRDATFRNESCFRVVTVRNGDRLTLHSIRSVNTLVATGFREIRSRFRKWTNVAGDVRNCGALGTACRTIPFHEFVSRLLDRHRTYLPTLRFYYRSLRLATSFLHNRNRRCALVHHVVFPRLQHTIGTSANNATRTRVHRVERIGGDQGTSGHESPVESYLYQSTGVGHRNHNIWSHLGTLHFYYARTRVHEKYPEFWHSKQWNHERLAFFVLVPVIGHLLLHGRRSCEAEDSQSDECPQVDDGVVANYPRFISRTCGLFGHRNRQRSHNLEHCGDYDNSKLCRRNGKHRWFGSESCRTRSRIRTDHPYVRKFSLANDQRFHSYRPKESYTVAALFSAVIGCGNRYLHHVSTLRNLWNSAVELPKGTAKRRRATTAEQQWHGKRKSWQWRYLKPENFEYFSFKRRK